MKSTKNHPEGLFQNFVSFARFVVKTFLLIFPRDPCVPLWQITVPCGSIHHAFILRLSPWNRSDYGANSQFIIHNSFIRPPPLPVLTHSIRQRQTDLTSNMKQTTRRDFLKSSMAAGLPLGLPRVIIGGEQASKDTERRMPGCIANFKDILDDPHKRICRPRQIYVARPPLITFPSSSASKSLCEQAEP
jgi:hypothetical protein